MRAAFLPFVSMFLFPVAQATTFSCGHTYYTSVHFDGVAYGKKVSAVWAHVGVLQEFAAWKNQAPYWSDVQHIELQPQGDSFAGKVVLQGYSSYANLSSKGGVVQYWVYFADGSEMQTESLAIPTVNIIPVRNDSDGSKLRAARAEQQKILDSKQDVRATENVEVEMCSLG